MTELISPEGFLQTELGMGISPDNPKFVRLAMKTAEAISDYKDFPALDFGAGTGVYSYALQRSGFDVTALDIWDSHRNYMKERYSNALKVVEEPFPARLMLFIEVAEHMTDEQIFAAIGKIQPEVILFSSTSQKIPGWDEQWGHINIKDQSEWIKFWDRLGYEKVRDTGTPCSWAFILRKRRPLPKNLIYFIWWNEQSPYLEMNLKLMDKYWDMFDGQRIVKVAGVKHLPTGYRCLEGAEIVENDRVLNEAPHFRESLSRLDTSKQSLTFYGHAKGVSRSPTKQLGYWVNLLYKGNLSGEPNLKPHQLFSGCFGKMRAGSRQVPMPWHYSGSFYWFRTQEVLNRYKNRPIPKEINTRWFTECFPGFMASEHEAEHHLYKSAEKFNCYNMIFWHQRPHLIELAEKD